MEKKYRIIFSKNIDEIENKINDFVEKRPEYDLKNIKIFYNEFKLQEFMIIFEKSQNKHRISIKKYTSNMFNAKIIADNKNEFGNRITTFVITFPRIILAEFNTHRMLSRNSASSRAIPFEKMLKSVEENPFIPIRWMKDHRGMQGSEYFENEHECEYLKAEWLNARDNQIESAIQLNKRGVTKQFINRLLEPFMWHTCIVTATEWENFFALRAHPAAEIHMQEIAYMMLDEYNKSQPRLLKQSEWHIPFENEINEHDLNLTNETKIKISTAMCARVSYTIVGEEKKQNDFVRDIELHDKLLSMGHMSPFEHCAQVPENISQHYEPHSGNFIGFYQYRKMISNENKNDSRVIKK